MTESDKIALAALVVAVIGFVVNVWYTRRQFQVTTTPALGVDYEIRMCQRHSQDNPPFVGLTGTYISLRIENLSSSVSISEVCPFVEVKLIENRFNRKQINKVLTDNPRTVAPLENERLLIGWGLEGFLSEQFPNHFHELEKHYDFQNLNDRTTYFITGRILEHGSSGHKDNAYQSWKPCTVELTVGVLFRPGIHNARVSTIKQRYKLIPVFQSGEMFKSFLAGWEFQRLERR